MIGNDYRRFSELLDALGEMYELGYSPLLIEKYWQSLKKYSLSEIETALMDIVKVKFDDRFIQLLDIKWQIHFNYNFKKVVGGF